MNILVTAGPTREYIDPVRFISNASTGLMGYAIAREAQRRGHRVTLVSGPTNLVSPRGVRYISATSSSDIKEAVNKNFKGADCVIMAAAVSDFRPSERKKSKIKKEKKFILELEKTADILAELGKKKRNKILVGFALETDNLASNAKKKLKDKNLDMIIANIIDKNSPFGEGEKDVVIIERAGATTKLNGISKERIAKIILNKVEALAT